MSHTATDAESTVTVTTPEWSFRIKEDGAVFGKCIDGDEDDWMVDVGGGALSSLITALIAERDKTAKLSAELAKSSRRIAPRTRLRPQRYLQRVRESTQLDLEGSTACGNGETASTPTQHRCYYDYYDDEGCRFESCVYIPPGSYWRSHGVHVCEVIVNEVKDDRVYYSYTNSHPDKYDFASSISDFVKLYEPADRVNK